MPHATHMHPHRGFLQSFVVQQALFTAGTLNIALFVFALVCASLLLFAD